VIEHERETVAALTATPAFSGLPAVELAKLVAVVEQRSYRAGEVIIPQGSAGDGLYIVRSGLAEVVVEGSDGLPHAVGLLARGGSFGELGLLSDTPPGAWLIALRDAIVLVLPRDRFHQLVGQYPELGLELGANLGRRLQDRNRRLAELSTELAELTERSYSQLAPEDQARLRRVAVLDCVEPAVARDLGGEALLMLLAVLADTTSFVSLDVDGSFRLREYFQTYLLRQLAAGVPDHEIRALHLEVASILERHGDLIRAMQHYGYAERWEKGIELLKSVDGTLVDGDAERLRLWLASVPATALGTDPEVAARRAEATGEVAEQQQAAPSRRWRLPRKRGAGLLLAGLLFLGIVIAAPPAGLSREGQLALALLAASVPLMVFEVLADHLVALLLVVGWTAMGLVPARVALSGYASGTWFLVLAILGIGVGIGKTGLLYRAVLTLANWAPRSLIAQALTLAVAGLIFTPAMPNATSRMALSAPVGLEMIDAFGLSRRGSSSVLVGLAMLLGFGMMGTLFLTGTSSGLLVHSVLPEDVRREFSFVRWILGALPLHLVLFALTFAAAAWMFRDGARQQVRTELLRAQSVALGRPTLSEWLVGLVTAALIVGLITEPWHGINAAWLAIGALLVLGALGIVDTNSFRNGINWSFLIFFGAITSLGEVLTSLKVDAWLGETMSVLLAPLASAPALFLVGLALAGMATCFAIRWQAACVLLTIVMSPPAAAIGISPFVIGIIALTATNLWVFPYQSTIYQALYGGVDGRLFSHDQIRPVATVYAVAVLVGVVVSVPFWRAMGLVP
jgi:divalent anion:Na+ symporter, DASS family